MNMLGNIPHQKFCFYHLPTRGRAGIKLGILIRLQRIYNFWLFHAVILSFLDVLQSFYSHCISFFWCSPIDIVSSASWCFLHVFTSQEINIKRSPNAAKLLEDFFGARGHPVGQGCTWGVPRGAKHPPGCARKPMHALVGCAHLRCPLNRLFAL